jgi:hypothetical protein
MPSLLARPHILALPCLELWCAGLVIARSRGAAPSFCLLPLMTVWANLHGSFMIGLLMAAALTAEAVLAGSKPRGQLVSWFAFAAAAWLAALITPDGLDGLLLPIRLLRMRDLGGIEEWQPTDFGQPGPLAAVILIALYFGLSGQVRLPRFRVLLLLGLIWSALQHTRNTQLVGIIGALLVAEGLGDGVAAAMPQPPDETERRRRSRRLAWGFGPAVGALLLALRAVLPVERSDGPAYPASALAHVSPERLRDPVLNDYAFGGYLIFRGVRPFIDSRADMYGDEFLDWYKAIIRPDPGALELALERYAISWSILATGNPAAALMDRRPGWKRLYADHFAVVYLRSEPP